MGGEMTLTTRERSALPRHAGARNGRADQARQARLILLRAAGLTEAQIRATLDGGGRYSARCSPSFATDRLAGLFARYAAHALNSDGSDRGQRAGVDHSTRAGGWVHALVIAQAGGRVGA